VSKENVEIVREFYTALNAAYKGGDVSDLARAIEQGSDVDFVVTASGRFPETGEWRGPEGAFRLVTEQMEAFTEMWLKPEEYIDAGDQVVVPIRFGGHARHTGIDVEFPTVHVITFRNGKATRLEMYPSKAEALEAAGLSEQDLRAER
jgi:ketosteroid isomerase-like protein